MSISCSLGICAFLTMLIENITVLVLSYVHDPWPADLSWGSSHAPQTPQYQRPSGSDPDPRHGLSAAARQWRGRC